MLIKEVAYRHWEQDSLMHPLLTKAHTRHQVHPMFDGQTHETLSVFEDEPRHVRIAIRQPGRQTTIIHAWVTMGKQHRVLSEYRSHHFLLSSREQHNIFTSTDSFCQHRPRRIKTATTLRQRDTRIVLVSCIMHGAPKPTTGCGCQIIPVRTLSRQVCKMRLQKIPISL